MAAKKKKKKAARKTAKKQAKTKQEPEVQGIAEAVKRMKDQDRAKKKMQAAMSATIDLRINAGFAARLMALCKQADPSGIYDGQNMLDMQQQMARQLKK